MTSAALGAAATGTAAPAPPRPRAVVVVAYRHADLVRACLTSLTGETVVVVDNSADPAIAAAARAAGASYVDAGGNLGFAAGVNLGLTHLGHRPGRPGGSGRPERIARDLDPARPDVLLLNPDARIGAGGPAALQRALHAAPDLAAAGARLVRPDGGAQRSWWPFPAPRRMWFEALGLHRLRRAPGAESAGDADGFLVGAALLLRAEAIADLGGLDERYFLYAEEADWQRRALARGWRVTDTDVQVAHLGGGTADSARTQQLLFHAGQETYVRRWYGRGGWTSYRAAAAVGALARGAVLPGANGTLARQRAALYLRGPARVAARRGVLPPRPAPPDDAPLRITHVVVTGNAAGTERYVADLAGWQAGAGHEVTVVGGDEAYFRARLPGAARWRAGSTLTAAAGALAADGRRDVVHTHLTAADLVGAAALPLHHATLVSTRHFAAGRGSTAAARVAGRLAARAVTLEICTGTTVRDATGGTGPVIAPGVPPDDARPDPDARTVVVAQRLDPEKDTATALDAWRASGLGDRGWTLLVCGSGQERAALTARADGLAGVVWAGWVDDVRVRMLQAAALLAPAPGEPFGLTVVEAMSRGLPVIAAAGGGHRETVGVVPGAMLFRPGDVAGCAAALRGLADLAPSARAAYGADLRAAQRTRFDLATQARAVTDAYRRARFGLPEPPAARNMSDRCEVSPTTRRSLASLVHRPPARH